MTQKDYTVEGRQFRTGTDYARALRDKRTIDELRSKTNMANHAALVKLKNELDEGRYSFSPCWAMILRKRWRKRCGAWSVLPKREKMEKAAERPGR